MTLARARGLTLTIFLVTSLLIVQMTAAGAQEPPDREVIELADGQIIVIIEGGSYQVSFDGRETFSRGLPQRTEIKLRFATFDPLADSEPEIPPGLEAPDGSDAYIVQFKTQPLDVYRELIEEMGGTVHIYLPDQAHIVRMAPEARDAVEALSFVRWVGAYHPAYKLEEDLVDRLQLPIIGSVPPTQADDDEPTYSIMLLERGAEAQRLFRSEADDILEDPDEQLDFPSPQGFRAEVRATDNELRQLAGLGGVLFIDRPGAPEAEEVPGLEEDPGSEPIPDPGIDMDLARELSGALELETVEGYRGQGVRGEVMDTRLLTTHQDFQGTAPGGLTPIIRLGNQQPTLGCGDNGHGTCVYGIVFGDGTGNAQATGLLPEGQGIFSGFGVIADRYQETEDLINDFRAVFQTNSWGDNRTTQYNTISAEMDDILFLNDILVTQSQSNAGNQMSRPQAWAKNIVAVGGYFHQNTLNRDDDTWNTGGASIGPAADGRMKPDVANFYDSIFTTSSTGDTNYANFCCTSGATPITAGYFGLMFQMWADGVFDGGPGQLTDPDQQVFDRRPRAATSRALMFNTAFQYDFVGGSVANQAITRAVQGWGSVDAGNLYNLARQHQWDFPILIDESALLVPLGVHQYDLEVGADQCFIRATLVYKDAMGNPAATEHRIDDLSLRLTSPGGTVYWGNNGLGTGLFSTPGGSSDTINTVENVILQEAELGTWTIEVLGDEIVQGNFGIFTASTYALVVTKCAELDAEVVGLEVTGPSNVVNPPHEIIAGEDVTITLEAEVRNSGAGGPDPASFNLTFDATAPANCSIVGAAQKVEAVTLAPSTSASVETDFVVHCTEASFHEFTFGAEIVVDTDIDPDVRDTDPTNNALDIQVEVGVVKQVQSEVIAIGFDIDRLRAVINPVEPLEPMVGLGSLSAPWAGAGDRPLPWARTANDLPAVAQCPDPAGHIPQPGHGNWENPRDPITLVVPDPGEPISVFIDLLDCTDDDINIDTTVTLTVISGECHFGGNPSISLTQEESNSGGWNLTAAMVEFPDSLTMADTGCTIRVDVEKEPAEIHFELLGETTGSIEVELVAARDGRMIGGGSVFDGDGARYTHGFQLMCGEGNPNNLQVNWDDGYRFHLQQVVAVLCFDDPALDEAPPVAGFNTMLGNVFGRLNGIPSTPLWFHFTDDGQPGGGGDLAEFVIDGGSLISGYLDNGNHQAHAPRGRPQ